MPWRTQTVKEQRIELVTLARKPGANISELARRFGVSRKTIYKWLNRDDMDDRSRRPKSSPKRTPQAQEARILATRDDHPAWGARKIAHVLSRDSGIVLASSTVNSTLRRNGRISPEASRAATAWQRFEHPFPNDLWQMDFKGYFSTSHEGHCHPLTILNDHSRYNTSALTRRATNATRACRRRSYGCSGAMACRSASTPITAHPGATVGKAR